MRVGFPTLLPLALDGTEIVALGHRTAIVHAGGGDRHYLSAQSLAREGCSMTRILIVAAALALAAFALWHPAPAPLAVTAQPSPRRDRVIARRGKSGHACQAAAADSEAVVFVAGAVAQPGTLPAARGRPGRRRDPFGGRSLRGGRPVGGQPRGAGARRRRDLRTAHRRAGGSRRARSAGGVARATPAPARDVDVNTADASRRSGAFRASAARSLRASSNCANATARTPRWTSFSTPPA